MVAGRYPRELRTVVLFLALVLVTVAALAAVALSRSTTVLRDVIDEVFSHAGQEAISEIRTVFSPAEAAVEILAALPIGERDSLTARLTDLPALRQALDLSPSLPSLFIGYPNGDFLMLRRLAADPAARDALRAPAGAAYAVQSIERLADGGATGTFVFFSAELTEIARVDHPEYPSSYDPRTRPWYQAAERTNQQIKTPPYVFFSSHKVGTTVARAALRGHAVLAADITLNALAAGIGRDKLTTGTEVALFDDSTQVIANSDASKIAGLIGNAAKPSPITLSDLGTPVLTALAQRFRDSEQRQALLNGGPTDIRTDDRNWRATVMALPVRGSGNYYLALAVPSDEMLAPVQGIRRDLAIGSLVVLGLLIGLALFLRRAAARSAAAQTEALRNVAGHIDEELQSAIHDIRSLTEGMAADATQLFSVAQNTSTNAQTAVSAATQALASAETVSSASEEMHASITEIAHQASDSRNVARRAVERADDARNAIGSLQTVADKVGSIVNLIDGIAARTDLLAINAAVEAARAGETGKGFAVVAGEVKALANQTQSATVEIAAQIGAMRRVVAEVGNAIDAMTTIIGDVDIAASSISSAAEQQTAATNEIARAVGEVASASSGVAEMMAHLAGEARQGQELAEGVRGDSGRISETVGGLGRSLTRVVRTSSADVDRRLHPRHSTLLPATVLANGKTWDASVIEFSEGGCSLRFTDQRLVRATQPVEISCKEFGRPRKGTIVAPEGAVGHVQFALGNAVEPDMAASLAESGARLILDKAKSDHREFVASVRAAVDGKTQSKASDLANHHTCRLGKWYDRVTDDRILLSPAYKALLEPHQRVHQAGKSALINVRKGDRRGAEMEIKRMTQASQEVITLLDTLERSVGKG
jgi:methyl-accepting chemotaxis protein